MTAPGPLALVGGGEHLPASRDVDRWLLEASGRPSPKVVVLPVAALPLSLPAVASLARTSWQRLGARARVVVPADRPRREVLDEIAGADVVVLPGGVPERVLSALGASPVGEAVLDRWRAGAALAGSSAGAMALFAWRLRIASPRPLALTPGLGAVDGYVAVPHFDRFVRRWPGGWRFAERHRRRLRGLGVLGVDESTAVVVADGEARVVGPGAVTVGDGSGWRHHRAGEAIDLDLGIPAGGTGAHRVAADRARAPAIPLRGRRARPSPVCASCRSVADRAS